MVNGNHALNEFCLGLGVRVPLKAKPLRPGRIMRLDFDSLAGRRIQQIEGEKRGRT